MTGIPLIAEYFRLNNSYVYDTVGRLLTEDTYHVEIAASTHSGVALGLLTVWGNPHFKTFVTYDMLKGEQVEKYVKNEIIRKEIHGN